MNVKIKLLPDAQAPVYATSGSAGMDLSILYPEICTQLIKSRPFVSYIDADCQVEATPIGGKCTINAGSVIKFNTGICLQIPPGYVGLIKPRSSTNLKGLHVCEGVIDSDYRGEVCIVVRNVSADPVTIYKGDRLAQILFQRVEHAELEVVESLDPTERGAGGFGSTGK